MKKRKKREPNPRYKFGKREKAVSIHDWDPRRWGQLTTPQFYRAIDNLLKKG